MTARDWRRRVGTVLGWLSDHAVGLTALATLLTALAAFLTALYTYQQVQATHDALRVQTLEGLDSTFEGPRIRRIRRRAADTLLQFEVATALGTCPDIETRPVDDILDFFETLALLVHKKALDPEMVWSTFYYWIDGYGTASDPLEADERQANPREWEELTALREELQRIETKKGGERTPTDADEVHEFLLDESGAE